MGEYTENIDSRTVETANQNNRAVTLSFILLFNTDHRLKTTQELVKDRSRIGQEPVNVA